MTYEEMRTAYQPIGCHHTYNPQMTEGEPYKTNGGEVLRNTAYGNKILDIGGGNGHFSHFIGAKNVTIIDVSDSGLNFASQKFGFQTIKNDLNTLISLNLVNISSLSQHTKKLDVLSTSSICL